MMMLFASAAAFAAVQSAAPGGGAIDLFCRGRGDRTVTEETRLVARDGSTTRRSETRQEPFASAIRIRVVGETGQALIPDAMLADDDARGWHDIRKLDVTPTAIKGKIDFNWLFSPVMVLDRGTGTLRISGSMANFSGDCTRFDPRTSIMAAPRPAVTARPAASAAPGDPHAAARAMAGQTDARQAARSAALKADMAFRLFNAGKQPITELVMIDRAGTASRNWLRAGESVAPQAFRAMNFAHPATCGFTVRVTYADTSRAVRPIDFCGKDVLYANGQDLWAE